MASVGFAAATVIVIAAMTEVNGIVLPRIFAAVLAVIFKPLAGVLKHPKFKPTLAGGLVVLGLAALAWCRGGGYTLRGVLLPVP
jgi:predicted PurR-regulated permease PerM